MCSVGIQILQNLKDSKVYRHSFVAEKVRSSLATQIKTIREQRGMSQPELAHAMGKSQSWVSRLEDPNQPAPTVPSLLQVAEAYDVDLEIRFGRFSTLIDHIDGLNQESLKVPSFSDELPVLEKKIAVHQALANLYRNQQTHVGYLLTGSTISGTNDRYLSVNEFTKSEGQRTETTTPGTIKLPPIIERTLDRYQSLEASEMRA